MISLRIVLFVQVLHLFYVSLSRPAFKKNLSNLVLSLKNRFDKEKYHKYSTL